MLYKYCGHDTAQGTLDLLTRIVAEATLLAADPRTFNDPHEFKIAVDLTADADTALDRYITDNPGRSHSDFTHWWDRLGKPTDWYVTQSTRSKTLSTYGVACLSRTHDNHLMWSHYARNHTGFCIGYDAPSISSHPSTAFYGPVKYRRSAPRFRYFYDLPDDYTRKVFFTKSTPWAYEREVRAVFDTPGLYKLGTAAIREVVIGCRAPHCVRVFAEQHCDNPSVTYSQMSEDFSGYTISRSPIKKGAWKMTSQF
jgi:hypothetical protein